MILLSNYIIKGLGLFRGYKYDTDELPDDVKWDVSRDYSVGDFHVSWGSMVSCIPQSDQVVMETGFFKEAAHMDRLGLYADSSLCEDKTIGMVDSFDSPAPALEMIQSNGTSKYPQAQDKEYKSKEIEWDGIVLACQNPKDRSVRSVGTVSDYMEFLELACKYYGKNLFVKLHPWNSGPVGDEIRTIAEKHNCQSGKIDQRIIQNCQFVLTYNSTYAVDCFLRGVSVAQYAPGYFWKFPCVQYTDGSFPDEIKTDKAYGYKLCDFLLWKYCFHAGMGLKKFTKLVRIYKDSNELFPMLIDSSYGYHITKEDGE